jgi:hypothetical protein
MAQASSPATSELVTLAELAAIVGLAYIGYKAFVTLSDIGEKATKAVGDAWDDAKNKTVYNDFTTNVDGSQNNTNPDNRIYLSDYPGLREAIKAQNSVWIISTRQEGSDNTRIRMFFRAGANYKGKDLTGKWVIDDLSYYRDPEIKSGNSGNGSGSGANNNPVKTDGNIGHRGLILYYQQNPVKVQDKEGWIRLFSTYHPTYDRARLEANYKDFIAKSILNNFQAPSDWEGV